jgi:hypothetical protein
VSFNSYIPACSSDATASAGTPRARATDGKTHIAIKSEVRGFALQYYGPVQRSSAGTRSLLAAVKKQRLRGVHLDESKTLASKPEMNIRRRVKFMSA